MYVFYPKRVPEFEVYYDLIPGQVGTWEDPAFDCEIIFKDIELSGVPVSIELYELLMKEYEKVWTEEIKKEQV